MPKKPMGLGRGIDNIFFENSSDGDEKINSLRLSQISPKSDQPRKVFEGEALASLADSIAAHGVLQPILVREIGGDHYEIIAGERRYRAAKMAGLSDIPVIILSTTDVETAQIALIENIQREDLNPLEEAAAYRSLIDEYHLTQEEVAQKIGRGRSTITNSLRLLELPDEITAMLSSGELSAGHARALLGMKSRKAATALAEKAVRLGLSVRAVEDGVRAANRKAELDELAEKEPPFEPLVVDYFSELEHKSTELLGRCVKISHTGRKKCVEISYEDNEDLEALLIKVCGKEISEN